MKLLIFLICVIYLLYKVLKCENKGIEEYFIFSMITPNITIANYTLSFELLLFFPFIFFLLLKKHNIFNIHRKCTVKMHLWIYLFILSISSLIGILKYNNSINVIAFFSYFRILILIYVLHYAISKDNYTVVDNILSKVLYVNLAVSIIQLTIPNSVEVFYDFYYKDSLTPLLSMRELGYFNRAYGTFGTPVLLGIFSLLSFSFYMGLLADKCKCKRLLIKIGVSLAIGLMALSKSVIIGIPAIIVSYYLMMFLGIIKLKNKKILAFPIIIAPVCLFIIKFLEQKGLYIFGYLRFLFKPIEVFTTRYNISSGILKDTYSVILDNLLFGVGLTNVENTFAGDSMYINILYTTGVIGVLFLSVLLFRTILLKIKEQHVPAILITITLLMVGFAVPIHVEFIGVPLISYILAGSDNYG